LFAALGLNDQIIAVIPSLDLVIVRQGVNPLGAGSEAVSPEQNILFGKIARAFGYTGQAQPWDLQIRPAASGVRLEWTSWFGRNYRVQQSATLAASSWQSASPAVLPGAGLPMTAEFPLSGQRNFFRIAVEP
jgi:hypothetical protein